MGSKFYKSDAVFPLQGVLLTTPKCIYLQCQILYLYFDCLLLQRTLLQKLNSHIIAVVETFSPSPQLI